MYLYPVYSSFTYIFTYISDSVPQSCGLVIVDTWVECVSSSVLGFPEGVACRVYSL